MLFVVSGSSGSGKTTLAQAVSSRVPGLQVRELSEIADEPWDGDIFNRWWRRNLTERWLRIAVELDDAGEDFLLTEGVLGEVLAAPSAPEVSGIAACLLDCEDDERVRRLNARDPSGGPDPVQLKHFLNWSNWLRSHAADPQFRTDPILHDQDTTWYWSRWNTWAAGDPRWSVLALDTTHEPVERSSERLAGWIEEQRDLLQAGELPLSGAWC